MLAAPQRDPSAREGKKSALNPSPSSSLVGQLFVGSPMPLPPHVLLLLQANKLVKYLMIKDYKKIPIKRSGGQLWPLPELCSPSSPNPPQGAPHRMPPPIRPWLMAPCAQYQVLTVLPSAGLTEGLQLCGPYSAQVFSSPLPACRHAEGCHPRIRRTFP